MTKITILLPALNESESIGAVIAEIKALNLDAEIIVIDNGSTDDTAKIADSLGCSVIQVPERGKGNAIREAVKYVQSDYTFMLDSDGTYPASYLPEMLKLLEQGFDVVAGKRKLEQARLYNRVCNLLLNIPNWLIYGAKNKDVCTGMWGFKTPVLKDLELSATGFTLEADIYTQCYIKKYKLWNLPITYRKRLGGESKIRFSDGLKIASVLLKRSLK